MPVWQSSRFNCPLGSDRLLATDKIQLQNAARVSVTVVHAVSSLPVERTWQAVCT